MPHNENSRVKIPALVHFTRLGYKYISLRKYEGVIDDDTNILVDVLCDAINRINATSLTTTDVQKIVNALKAMLENDDLGREFYSVLINGYNGLKLIDFEDFGGTVNSYHVVTEMTCKNGSDEFRPDITPLINGIPLAFIEVKKPNNKGGIKAEYDRMLMRVKNKKFRRFINLTQIMVFSNNSEYDDTEAVPLEGAFYSTISYEKLFFSHFREEDEKLLTSVPEKDEAVENFILTDNNLSSIKYSPEYVTNSSPVSPTNRIITSLFSFERILTFLKYAIAYVERTDENGITHLEKHLMRYPQFFATKAIENKLNAGVKNGIIWHTQGSGKTALAYYNVRYLTDYYQKHGNGPYDLDYNLLVMKADDEYRDPRLLKDTIRNALNKAVGGKFFSDAQDSTSCLTALLHFKDTPNVEFSFDVAIIKKNPNGNYMRLVHNKPWNQYTWNEVPRSHQVKDRADDIKEEGLWQEVRDKYLEKKNMYLSWQDHNHPSFVVYVEAVNEVYNRYFNRGGGYSVQSIF